MTVKELIEKLKTMNQDAVVVLSRDSEYRELREDEINEIDQIFDADEMEVIMTNQEMFDKAWNGLKSQGFKRCLGFDRRCIYSDGKGKHCAWGWVDESLTNENCYVEDLARNKIGIAGTLDLSQLDFVVRLQICHDNAYDEFDMQERLQNLAKQYNLIVPE